MDPDSPDVPRYPSKDDPNDVDHRQEQCDCFVLTVPFVTPPTSDDGSSGNEDESALHDPPMRSREDPDTARATMLTASMETKQPKRPGGGRKSMSYSTHHNVKNIPRKAKTRVDKRQRLIDAKPKATLKTQKTKEEDLEVRLLMTKIGLQHVYFGRGEPIRNNPGNIRFREIVDRYHLEYKQVSNNSRKGEINLRKHEIVDDILQEVTRNGSKFFVIKKTSGGHASQEMTEEDKEVLKKTGHALRDARNAWKCRAKIVWSWADSAQQQLSWFSFPPEDGQKLEHMFRKDEDRREEVPVTVGMEKLLVDVTLKTMHRVDAYGIKFFTVRRLEPLVEINGGESICESREIDAQQDDCLSVHTFDVSVPDGPEASIPNSDFYPFSSAPRMSPAAPARMKTMPRNGIPDVIWAKKPIKTKDENIYKGVAKAALVCWSWKDPADDQPSWSDFSNGDRTALELVYQKNRDCRWAVPVSIRKEKHLVDVTSMEMHRVDSSGNKKFPHLKVRRLEPKDEIDIRELICVSDESGGQFATSSSAESSEGQRSGASGAPIRSSSHSADGGGGRQSNLYRSRSMAQQSKDEYSVFAYKALDEEILEQITVALEEERWGNDRSPVPPIPPPCPGLVLAPLEDYDPPGAKQPKRPGEGNKSMSYSTHHNVKNIPRKAKTHVDKRHRLTDAKPKATLKTQKTKEVRRAIEDDDSSMSTPGASPLHHSLKEDGDGSSHQSITSLCVICMSVRHTCHLGSCRGDTHSVFSDPSAKLSVPWSTESMNSLGNPSSLVPLPVPTPPKKKIEEALTSVRRLRSMPCGPTIRRLIKETGEMHVYFGQGAPITNNPGNKQFRRIVDKYHLEYKGASSHTAKRAIKNKILGEVKKNGSRFFCFGVDMAGNFKPKLVTNREVSGKTGHALRDVWKYRANWWSWADPTQERRSWSDFSKMDGTALEKMFQEDLHRREEVSVAIEKQKHLVDVSSMMMHRVDASGNKNCACLLVRRADPDEEMDSRELIDVSEENDGQLSSSSSAKSSGSQSSGASWATNSSFKHDTKQSVVDTARKFESMTVQEADDVPDLPTTTETSMGIDDSLTLYRHKCRLKSANTSSKNSGQN